MGTEGGAIEVTGEIVAMVAVTEEGSQEAVVNMDRRIRTQATVATLEEAVGLHYR